jgi:TPR repeat protein
MPSNGPDLQQLRTTVKGQDAEYWFHKALTLTEKSQFLECLDCLRRAVKADPEHKQALYALGQHYLHGQGIKEDPSAAASWFRKSAEFGFAPAQDKLGLMYEHGIGVAKNEAEAVKWYALGAQSGNRDAQYHLGVMYGIGNGLPTDFVKSSEWLLKAAKQGHVEAQATLGQMLLQGADGIPKDYEEAATWLRKAADAGDTQAQVTLAELFMRGKGLQKNLEEAARYFRLAAEQGDADGQQGLQFVNKLLGRWTVSEERLPGEEEWEFEIRRMVESSKFSFNPPDDAD